jgi:hypothetical protein
VEIENVSNIYKEKFVKIYKENDVLENLIKENYELQKEQNIKLKKFIKVRGGKKGKFEFRFRIRIFNSVNKKTLLLEEYEKKNIIKMHLDTIVIL